jgi:xanthine dehydrogenase molybdopterin-binding subunit B
LGGTPLPRHSLNTTECVMHVAADHVLEGTIKLGGQEHFYLEPNGAIVVPTESDEYLLISSTQAPNKHQVCCNLLRMHARVPRQRR